MAWLSEIDTSSSLLIVHPNFKSKSLFLSELAKAGWLDVYHRFSEEITDFHLLANELAPLRDRGCLILDDADLVDPIVLAEMLEELLPHNFIVLFVQDFPSFIKANPTIREHAQIFPTDDAMLPDYLNIDNVVLEVNALSNHPIRTNGKRKYLRDKNAIETLIYMLIQKYSLKSDLLTDLSDAEDEKIYSLSTIFNHIKTINELTDDIDNLKIIVSENGGFKTNDSIEFRMDWAAFEKSMKKVLQNSDDIEALDHAITIYHHSLLPKSEAVWSIKLREELKSDYIKSLLYKAELLATEGNVVSATTIALSGFRLNNRDEDAAYIVMCLFEKQNQVDMALDIYDQHVAAWEKAGQTYYPSKRMVELVSRLQSD